MISKARLIKLPRIDDPRGSLTFIEGTNHIPFEIKRIYYLYNIPQGQDRGGHAHRELQQLFIAISGRFEIMLDDGVEKCHFVLNRPDYGLYITPVVWRELKDFSPGTVCCVLASATYEEADYIRSYEEFLKVVRGGYS